jgi:hypothetical protein
MALHLTERWTNVDISRLVQLAIEYDPQPPGGRIDWDQTDVPALSKLSMTRVTDNLADRPDLVERLIH